MTKSLTRIEKEIEENLAQFEQLQAQLNQAYQVYMTALGTALRRQLVLAVYQLCTRPYAKAFLALSEADRARLQQQLQQLGYAAEQDLQAALTRPYGANSSPSKQKLRSELLKRLPITPEQLQMIKDKLLQKHDRGPEADANPSEDSDEEGPIVIALDSEQLQSMFSAAVDGEAQPEPDDSEPDDSEPDGAEENIADAEASSAETAPLDTPEDEPSLPEMMADLAAIASRRAQSAIAQPVQAAESEFVDAEPVESESVAAIAPEPPDAEDTNDTEAAEPFVPPQNPLEFLRWGQTVETTLQGILKSLSLKTNRLLHRAEILSNQLPRKLFAAAIEADEGGNSSQAATAPNTMNLIVETDFNPGSEGDDPNILSVVVIRLRLAEIEMAETAVAASRSKLREGLARMKTLARKYQKLLKYQATAQAEAAWRGAWHEAPPPATDSETDELL
ncbi:MAG: hypothetical protein ACPGVO_12080 [Spirulinaceae cyanobacterium]